jgi:Second Messenger Oligonucleotide or Dinucleotide Synthetase domain
MISVSEAFEKFKARLEPGEREQQDAIRRRERVKELLDDSFHLDRVIITGSYQRWTKVRPLKDVDLFCILNHQKEGNYLKKSSRILLDAFGRRLAEEFGWQNVRVWDKCVTVKFGEPANDDYQQVFSVDVVPAFEDGKTYKIPDAYHPTGWMKTDPETHAELATKANEKTNAKWVTLVKMAKKCNDFHGTPVDPSFLVEVMALQLFVPPFSGSLKYEIKGFISSVRQQIGNVWPDPANVGRAVSEQMTSPKVATARSTLAKISKSIDTALLHESQNRIGNALATWRDEVFGTMFPLS